MATDISDNSEAPLTTQELNLMQSMLDSHDRAGFYMVYQAMYDGVEAGLQARISTFSGLVGGVALGANRLLQFTFGPTSAENSYPGIYLLSQHVAESAYNGIVNDADHYITDDQFFDTARTAWAGDLANLFPGQLNRPGFAGDRLV